MVHRTLAGHIRKLHKKFPVISVTGPRQSGKTTLLRNSFPDYSYVSLENPDILDFALTDPRGFFARYPENCIFDEIQRAPHLFSYLQQIVDDRNKPGMFMISGSQNFLLAERILQSLAGRVAVLNLLPFSFEEISSIKAAAPALDTLLYSGGYPRIFDARIDPADYYPNYLATYVERDVRQIKNITNLTAFQRFVKLCAGRTGGLLNLSSLGNDCGISHNTALAWLAVLETSYIVFLLQPHHANFNKRLVKSPKIYFYDTGLACSLLGIRNAKELGTHGMRGQLFENLIIAEFLKYRVHRGMQADLFFWRDKTGNEVDCIIESGQKVIPVEIKSGSTLNEDFFKGVVFFNKLRSGKDGYVVYGGTDSQPRAAAHVLSWKECSKAIADS
jgi:predicted AAA+ superfamily ATPase